MHKNIVTWRRNMLRLHQLDKMAKRLRRLEERHVFAEVSRDETEGH